MDLDPQQQAAVETESSKALVIAGAGAGKTRTLIERISYLTNQKKVSPYEIMAFTFTRKAAQEMRTRLKEKGARNIPVMGTMHAIALQMLRRFGENIGLRPSNITVYSEWESEYLLKEVASELGLFRKTWKVPNKEIDQAFADYYERGIEPDESHCAKRLFDTYLQRCRENNALTYGALLMGMKLLIPTMAKYLRVRHILVDEVQDIDPLQWRIIHDMADAFGASIFAVGDVDQSIYSFRSAVPEYLVAQTEFDLYLLEQNYRSGQNIVESANRLIRHNAQRIGKTMRPTRPDPGEIIHARDADSAQIASAINGCLPRDSVPWTGHSINEMAVLARNHALLKKLSSELTTRSISHTYIGRKAALTNSEEFRRFHAFLKLAVNPCDNFSFLLIKDLIGLSASEYSEIRVEAAKHGCSHFHAWIDFHDDAKNPFIEFFSTCQIMQSLGGAAFMIRSMAQGAYPYPNGRWGFDVEETFMFIFSWLSENPNGTIAEYLAWLATYDIQDEISEGSEGVTLCTIHAAKGLEWPVVVVAGCNEGILPSKQAIATGEIEEERRLMYVAMTRAREQLILAVRPEAGEKDGRSFECPASRFVGEAGL